MRTKDQFAINYSDLPAGCGARRGTDAPARVWADCRQGICEWQDGDAAES